MVSMRPVIFHSTIIGLFALTKVVAAYNVSVWGPGLTPDVITLPARYIYLQISDINEKSYTPDINTSLQVDISGQTKYGSCRIWISKLDRKDGSFIVRYKLYEICPTFEIKILYKGQHVASSPYLFKEPIIPDSCYCPQPNITHWMINNGCLNKYDQILVDLQPFPKVNMKQFSKKIIERFNKPTSVSMCHYVVNNNEIYRKCYGQHVGFNMFSDAILLSLARKVRLPDTEFFMNLGDWPLVAKKTEILPIFSWCGSTESHDIVVPTYDITESTLENMGRVMLDMLSVQGNIEKPWARKVQKAFWRGRDSREERLKLVDIARQHPHLYNASLTNFFFFRDQEEKYGPKQPALSFFKFFDYKYQINIDGTVAAYRFPYLLAGDSLVLKQDSPYYEHFYGLLKPNVHYLPFKRDLSDLTDKIKWAIDNDEKARKIATNGRNFARNNLMLQDIICYHAALLFEWSQRLVSEVSISEEMEHITQAEEALNCECPLSKLARHKDEL